MGRDGCGSISMMMLARMTIVMVIMMGMITIMMMMIIIIIQAKGASAQRLRGRFPDSSLRYGQARARGARTGAENSHWWHQCEFSGACLAPRRGAWTGRVLASVAPWAARRGKLIMISF